MSVYRWATLFIVGACKTPPAPTVTLEAQAPTPATSTVYTASIDPCTGASRHEENAAMNAAGFAFCSRDADQDAGFVALYPSGHDALVRHDYLGGPDAKGYAWTGVSKLLGAETKTIAGHAIITIRWEEHTAGYSSGMGGEVDIRAVVTAVCTTAGVVSCPFARETQRDMTVSGDTARRDREVWKIDIADDGMLTATRTKRMKDDTDEQPPVRVRLF